VWRQGRLAVCLFVVLGCSSPGALSQAPTSADAGGPDLHDQVLAGCMDYATRSCADSATCCNQAYGAYDADACVSFLRGEVCLPAADAVQNGVATYDDSAVEPCLAAHAAANRVCVPQTWDQILEIRKAIWSACKTVRGTSDAGKGCTTSVTCANPDGARTSNCIAGTCRVLEILSVDVACPFQSGAVSTCDTGLYCTTTQDTPGVCAPVLALGAACSGVLGDPSCGFGNYCDSVDKICKQTVNLGGPSCMQGFECVSFDCDRESSICAPAPAVVSVEQCLGAPDGM